MVNNVNQWTELPVLYSTLSTKERREVRSRYVAKQNGKCWHCKSDLDKDPPPEILEKTIIWSIFPKGFLNYPVHLHHNHNTNLTIGAVHAYCNAVLWQYHGE